MYASLSPRLESLGATAGFLRQVIGDLPILADVSRADLVLYARIGTSSRAIAVAHARPRSSTPLYEEYALDRECDLRTLLGTAERLGIAAVHTVSVRGAAVARESFAVRTSNGRLVGVLVRDAYWLAHERHRRRSKAFQDALRLLTLMVARGETRGADRLSPFGEHDGIVYVGPDRRIQYLSGVAAELYRHVGYKDSLLGRRINEIDSIDMQMVSRALSERTCLEAQAEQDGHTWVHKVLPVVSCDWYCRLAAAITHGKAALAARRRPRGFLVLVHDATEALRARRELESQMALLREVHHRVKNNLQVIASIMRLQARRVTSAEARSVLEESVNRVLSVAVVHEFLSQNAKGSINLKEIAHRIVSQVERGLVAPDKSIRMTVHGPDIWLPADRATQSALAINELVQNAIEHGMEGRDRGNIDIELVDHGDSLTIVITDDGAGLPAGFDIETSAHLGLQIVKSIVERDLRGSLSITGEPTGARARMHFAKTA